MISKFGACSQARKNNIVMRNYDWLYSNSCSFIVRTLARENRHASIGISSCNITEAEMTARSYNELFKSIPFQTLDGINDCGVYCGINIVPAGDKGRTTGTNKGKKDLPNICIPKFVLDNASTAREAVEMLKLRNVYSIEWDGELIELHALIADASETFIVEFVENKMIVIPFLTNEAIMTNFYLSGWNGTIASKCLGNTDDEIKATGLTPHAEGLERYLILGAGIEDVDSVDDALELMREVEFTKAYDTSTNPFWYSELVGARDLTIYSTAEEYAPVVNIFVEMFANRNRNNPETWQTVHSSAYDIINKSLKLRCQEKDTVYEYELNVN